MNRVFLKGNLGKDPSIRETKTGLAVCNFSIATSERWKDKTTGEWQERTEWHTINCWGHLAKKCGEKLSKGDTVFVEGKVEYQEYQSKDGSNKVAAIVQAKKIDFLKVKESNQPLPENIGNMKKLDIDPKYVGEEIPF